MFGGKSRLTVRALSHPNTVTIKAWKSLKLNIQVRLPPPFSTRTHVLVTNLLQTLRCSLIRYKPFKTHLHTSRSSNP